MKTLDTAEFSDLSGTRGFQSKLYSSARKKQQFQLKLFVCKQAEKENKETTDLVLKDENPTLD